MFEAKAPSGVEVQHAAGNGRVAGGWGALQQQVRKPILATQARVKIARGECDAKRIPTAGGHQAAAREACDDVSAELTVFQVGNHEQPGVAGFLDPGESLADLQRTLAPRDPKLPAVTFDEFGPRPPYR